MDVIDNNADPAEENNAIQAETEYVLRITKESVSECGCDLCKSCCTHQPGVGLPAEMTRIIREGYGEKVGLTTWIAGIKAGMQPTTMIAPINIPGKGCAFFTDEGKCELHDKGLKPLECRLATHKAKTIEEHAADGTAPAAFAIAKVWNVYQQSGKIEFAKKK